MTSMRDRMLAGELYIPDEPLLEQLGRAQELFGRYNRTRGDQHEERERIKRELFGSIGADVIIRPPFYCDYGSNISIGDGCFFNFNTVMLDVAPITIGRGCFVASHTQFLTAGHPIDPDVRAAGWEYGKPISVGDNVWIGGGVILCPGVTIGDDTVVGAGAVVTKDLPAGVVAVGNPARVLRAIGPEDRIAMPQR